MVKSEILQEKHRVQMQLSAETPSIRDYLLRTQRDAQTIATSYGLQLHYADSIFMLSDDKFDELLKPEQMAQHT